MRAMGCGASRSDFPREQLKNKPYPEADQNGGYPGYEDDFSRERDLSALAKHSGHEDSDSPGRKRRHNRCHELKQSAPIVIDEESLEEYVNLEKQIHNMEKKKILQRLHVAVDKMERLKVDVTDLQKKLKETEDEIEKRSVEMTDDDAKRIKDLANKKGVDTSKLDQRHQELWELIRYHESLDQEIKDKKQEHGKLEPEIAALNAKAAELLDLYLKQDELIASIFGGEYGSEEESRLEQTLDDLERKKQRIEFARRKWKEAQLLLEYACKQLAVAVQKWQNLPRVPSINLEVRYSLAEETKSRLMSAGEKIKGATELLPQVDLPYCTQEEIDALNEAAEHLYEDVSEEQVPEILDNYSNTHKRALALLRWFNRVLNTTIHRDLVDVSEEVRKTSRALRKERIRIIKEKMSTDPSEGSIGDSGHESEDTDEEAIRKMLSVCKDHDVPGHQCPVDRSRLSPLPDLDLSMQTTADDILSRPKREEVQGTLKDLRAEHAKEVERFRQGLQTSRARIEKQLGEKLTTRRQKRAMTAQLQNIPEL